MKKACLLALAGLILLSSVFFFPLAVGAHDMDECYRDHQICRARALNADAPWTKVALLLTVCDIGLGKCILDLRI